VEQHGNSPQKSVTAIIPARYGSTRLPGKLLLPIAGRPLILHTVDRASEAKLVDHVIVATDDTRIFNAVTEAGAKAVMTSPDHASGSDRIAEVAQGLPAGSLIVNVQGDEPLISPDTIDRAVQVMLDDDGCDIATTSEPILNAADVLSPDVVKVVAGRDGYAIYFSRSPIPFLRDAAIRSGGLEAALADDERLLGNFRKHTGLYVYRREYLLKYCAMPQSGLEKLEMLEQLRALESGARIRVVDVAAHSIGGDVAADLERVRRIVEYNE